MLVICLFCFFMRRRPPRSTRTDTLFPYTTLFRSVWAWSCRGDFRVSVIGRQRDPHIALVGLEREPPPDRDHPLNLFGEDGADILRQRSIGSKTQFICKFSGIALEIALLGAPAVADAIQIGRASCRERVCQYV